MGVASFFDVGSRNRGQLFSLHMRSIGTGIPDTAIERFFFDTDTAPMPAVSVDTEYPMPVSVSP